MTCWASDISDSKYIISSAKLIGLIVKFHEGADVASLEMAMEISLVRNCKFLGLRLVVEDGRSVNYFFGVGARFGCGLMGSP